jgi:hypothetical protein
MIYARKPEGSSSTNVLNPTPNRTGVGDRLLAPVPDHAALPPGMAHSRGGAMAPPLPPFLGGA